jgi:pimeloyl-ACP methyl ester carboxylesterase
MKKSTLILLAGLILLLTNLTLIANDSYTVVHEKDTIIGNLRKTDIKVQVGTNPLNAFSIQRVVKIGKSDNKGAIIMLPGSGSSFRIYEMDENGKYENSFAGFFASQGYDVYGYSPRTESFGFGECTYGLADCSIMKDWGIQSTLDDVEYLKSYIKKFHKAQKPVILGWSLGCFHAIASINQHPDDYAGAVLWEGFLYSKNKTIIEGNKIDVMIEDSIQNSGVYYENGTETIIYLTQLALTDPDGISPIPVFPAGTTNKQALILAGTTPSQCPPDFLPNYTMVMAKPDFSGFQYASYERTVTFCLSVSSYASWQDEKEAHAAIAGDRTFTKNLKQYKAPIYVVGAGHAFGKYMKDNIDLFGSHDITWNYISQFGHADHYLSPYHRQILDNPILMWLNKILASKNQKSSEAEETNITSDITSETKVFPNPTSGIIMISYDLKAETKINLYITDLTGKKIIDLIKNESQFAGKYELPFDLTQLNTGLYLYVLQTGNQTKSGKINIVK